MTTTTNNILLPYFKNTGIDGKIIYTQRMNRTNETLYQTSPWHRYETGKTINTNERRIDGKRTHDKTGFYLGSRAIRDRNHHKRGIQYSPGHHQHRKTHTTIQTVLDAKTQHLSQPWRLLLGNTSGERNTRRPLAEISILEKEL